MYVWVKDISGYSGFGYEVTQVTGNMPKEAIRVPVEKVDISLQKWLENAMRGMFGKVSW
jgi:hypothetical protein